MNTYTNTFLLLVFIVYVVFVAGSGHSLSPSEITGSVELLLFVFRLVAKINIL